MPITHDFDLIFFLGVILCSENVLQLIPVPDKTGYCHQNKLKVWEFGRDFPTVVVYRLLFEIIF